jgi:hypothetical protein
VQAPIIAIRGWLRWLGLLSVVLPTLCQAWQGPDLTGVWGDDAGGRYRIRQVGNTLVWFDDRSPVAMNVFQGTINGNAVDGYWWDVPGGQLLGAGRLSLRIETGDRIVKTGSSPDYGGTVITRDARQALGCFRDTGERDLPSAFLTSDRMTVGTCITNCAQQGFAYAGVQYGSQCFCGNSYGRYGPAENCDMRCAGNAGEFCGGFWANNIYSIRPGSQLPPPSRPGDVGICADPRTQMVMDQWLSGATPPENAQPGWNLRYDTWGRLVGSTPSATITGLPQGVDTPLSRCEYLWSIASRLTSANLGSLRDYVQARVR